MANQVKYRRKVSDEPPITDLYDGKHAECAVKACGKDVTAIAVVAAMCSRGTKGAHGGHTGG